MTDQQTAADNALLEELTELGEHPCRAHLPMGATILKAAERIKSLQAEVERLKSEKWYALHTDTANTLVQQGMAIESLEADRQRMREALDGCEPWLEWAKRKTTDADDIPALDELLDEVRYLNPASKEANDG